jgi:hypothetical protein
LRPDPFNVFASYPTKLLSADSVVTRAAGADEARLKQVCAVRMNVYAMKFMAPIAKTLELLQRLGAEGPLTVAAIVGKSTTTRERIMLHRTLCWLAKMGLVAIRTP